MPIVSLTASKDGFDGRQSERAMMVRRGIMKGFEESDLVFLPELTLPSTKRISSRRADLIALDRKGAFIIFEIKSSIADFQVDTKWHEYKAFCDRFYFATLPDVPMDIFPQDEGFIVADEHGCEILREAETDKLSSPTRKALTLRFARSAALRTKRLTLQEQFSETATDDDF